MSTIVTENESVDNTPRRDLAESYTSLYDVVTLTVRGSSPS